MVISPRYDVESGLTSRKREGPRVRQAIGSLVFPEDDVMPWTAWFVSMNGQSQHSPSRQVWSVETPETTLRLCHFGIAGSTMTNLGGCPGSKCTIRARAPMCVCLHQRLNKVCRTQTTSSATSNKLPTMNNVVGQ